MFNFLTYLHGLSTVLIKRENEFNDRLNSRASFRGFTALHYAALANSVEVTDLLLKAGADPVALNSAGHHPSKYAEPDTEVRKLLLNACKKVNLSVYSLLCT
jgi:ATP-dependent Clp protease ATP-binding subunit ClpB